jgi:predicted permease
MLRNWTRWWPRRSGDDFNEEIAAHLAFEADRLIAEGWAPDAARMEAHRRFGNVGRVREAYYDRTHVGLLDDLARDARYALRSLAKDKTYVIAAVGALGAGLAANIALFSLFSAVALEPLHVSNPERLVSISQVKPPIRFGPFSIADYLFYRDNARAFQSLAAAQPSHLRLAGIAASSTAAPRAGAVAGVAEPVIALFVTSNYFETFGVRPVAGRLLQPDDDASNGVFSALISDNYWQRRFARDPSIIGATLIVSGIRATVVGVSPRDFAGVRQEVPDLWVTLTALGDVQRRASRETTLCCEMVGRLADGYTLSQAQTDLTRLAEIRRLELPPSERQMTVSVAPAVSFGSLGETVRPLFAALQVAMLLVLLIACANVASLMLGRAAARDREIAVRLATGAGRGRLIRQLLTEGVVVAVVAGVVAAAATVYALAWAARFLSAYLSRSGGGTLALSLSADSRLALYVAVISISAGIVFALAPALQSSRADIASLLRTTAGTTSPNAGLLRSFLIAAQITLSIALLIVASGLGRSAMQLAEGDPGFESHNVLAIWLTNPQELALSAERARRIEAEVRARFAGIPGVQSLAVASRIPLGGNVTVSAMLPTERVHGGSADNGAPRYPYSFVSEDYFTTMGIRLLRGRSFTRAEVRDSAPVVLVSDGVARALWPRGDGLGKEIALSVAPLSVFGASAPLHGTARVIGVVSNVRGVSMASYDAGGVYLPKLTNDWSSRILLRMAGDPERALHEIARIVAEIEPALPVSVQRYDDIVATDGSVLTARLSAALLAIVGALGLLLASVGVYGMISYDIRQKQREIGIRMALGATAWLILRAALRGTTRWLTRAVVCGILLGVVGIKLTNVVLEGASVTASVLDPISMVIVPAVIAGVALLAALMSARKATRTNPAVVLRDG